MEFSDEMAARFGTIRFWQFSAIQGFTETKRIPEQIIDKCVVPWNLNYARIAPLHHNDIGHVPADNEHLPLNLCLNAPRYLLAVPITRVSPLGLNYALTWGGTIKRGACPWILAAQVPASLLRSNGAVGQPSVDCEQCRLHYSPDVEELLCLWIKLFGD